MSQEQYDIFGLMPPEEAEEFRPKPRVMGTTLSEVQHIKEKRGLPGEFKKGWEEAIGTDKPTTSVNPKPAISNSTAKVNVEKTVEYLSYKKHFCYAGHQIFIEDPSLSMEEIRKRMVKTFPELSKERTEMTYTPPVLPKKKGKKAIGNTDDQPSLGFELSAKEAVPLEELEKTVSEDEDSSVTRADSPELEESEDEDKDDSDETVEVSEKSGAKVMLLPSVVDGVERFGMVVPILKGARKGTIKENDLVRTFISWDDLMERPTVRNLLVASDGLYEVRITPVGIFKVRLTNKETIVDKKINEDVDLASPFPIDLFLSILTNEGAIGTENASEGVDLLLPSIPADLFLAIRDFFVRFALLENPLECLARIYHDGQKYFAYVPHQVVSHTRVQVLDRPEDLECAANNTLVMEVHSHNVMPAAFSGIDDRDELATGLYCVWGNLDQVAEKKASLSCRYSCGGHYRDIDIFDFVKGGLSVSRQLPDVYEMDEWMRKIYVRGGGFIG